MGRGLRVCSKRGAAVGWSPGFSRFSRRKPAKAGTPTQMLPSFGTDSHCAERRRVPMFRRSVARFAAVAAILLVLVALGLAYFLLPRKEEDQQNNNSTASFRE